MEPGEEYEELPTSKMSVHLMAGGMAGILEHCAMYPMDSIKTKMQSMNPSAQSIYRGILSSFRAVTETAGFMSTFRGVNAVAMGAGPAHALYFTTYETIKSTIGQSTNLPDTHPLVSGTSGMAATVIHDAFMNPFDVVKQRLQMHNSPYTTVRHCVRELLKHEGSRAFYRSYTTQLAMNIPFQTIHFSAYENFRAHLNPTGEYDPFTHVMAGGGAGALAAAVTTPLDVVKTVLNTQELHMVDRQKSYTNGMLDAAAMVYRTNGLRGFLRGMGPRILYQMPSTAVSWSVYEFFKHALVRWGEAEPEIEGGRGPSGGGGVGKNPSEIAGKVVESVAIKGQRMVAPQ